MPRRSFLESAEEMIGIRNVGDLIDELSKYDRVTPVRMMNHHSTLNGHTWIDDDREMKISVVDLDGTVVIDSE